MAHPQDYPFAQFITLRKRDLQLIARATQGEQQFADVVNEAWLLAHDMSTQGKLVGDLLDPSAQKLLISHLYQKLVRYTELNIRHADRLDHPAKYSELDDAPNPLLNTLVSDNDQTPLDQLIEFENISFQNKDPDVRHCLASAYVHLLRHFNNKMAKVAEHLLISVSYAYRCCAHARQRAIHQTPLPVPATDEKFMPGPWRRFRLRRCPVQLNFDFNDVLPL